MKKNYNVYLHYGEGEKEPFYIGASSDLDRPYNFTQRSSEWLELYEIYESKIQVRIMQVDDELQAEKLESELITKHQQTICNKIDARLLPGRTLLLPNAERTMKILGDNLKLARLRRNLSATQLCERAGISRPTLWKIENGDPNVVISSYVKVLFVMNLHEEVVKIAFDDPIGRKIQDVTLLGNSSRSS